MIHQLETQVKNESYPQIVDGQLNRKNEEKQSPKNLGDALKTEQTTAPKHSGQVYTNGGHPHS